MFAEVEAVDERTFKLAKPPVNLDEVIRVEEGLSAGNQQQGRYIEDFWQTFFCRDYLVASPWGEV